MTILALAPTPRFALLVKAAGAFKHSGKYYLLNGRWHAIKHDKPAPKGAPLSAHPNAAGLYMPVALTTEQIDQLKYPADKAAANAEMKAHNDVHLPKLLEHAANGDATAILGQGYGTNTHGKKKALAANVLLGMLGSHHQVTPGQKAGEHAAVLSHPGDHEAANQAAQQKADQSVTAAAKPEPTPTVKETVTVAPATGLAMPAFIEGKTTTGVVDYYQDVAQKVLDMAASGDTAGLAAMKADGLKPNAKGKISNTWAGKTANSKLLIALHAQATGAETPIGSSGEPSQAEKVKQATQAATAKLSQDPEFKEAVAIAEQVTASSKLSQIPWDTQLLPDSNTNAKSHNGKVAQIKAMAEAGDIAGLEAFKAGKNTYGQKQMKLAALAVAALKEDAPVAPKAAEPVPVAPEPKKTPAADLMAEVASAGNTSEALAAANTFLALHGSGPENLDTAVGALEAHGFTVAAETLKQDHGLVQLDDDDVEPIKPIKLYAAQMTDLTVWVKNGQPPNPELAELFGKISEDDKAAILKMAAGPKEGETKQGADGMLVFKDGHWHKQEVASTGKKLKASEAIALGKGFQTASGMKAKLKAMAVAGDVAGLQTFIDTHPKHVASKKYAGKLIEVMTGAAPAPSVTAAAPAAPAAAPAPSHPFGVEAMDSWKQTGPQGGSNPGGKFVDDQGVEWYCKFPGNDDVAKSEVLAAKLYAAAGIPGQDAKLITQNGKLGIASKWQTVSKLSPAALAKADGVAAGFAVDAWLGNWDVVGMGYDNLQVDQNGKAVRVDAGGSLEYRAQGGKKAFGPHVVEIDSLRDAKINHQSAAVFGKMSKADLTASVSKVLGVSDAKIHALVHAFGPGDAAAKQKMIETLIARKADLAAKFPKAKKEKKVKPFKPEGISEPPSFMNWGGSGKSGPSSKEFLNAANESAVQAIYAAAKTGSLEAVQGLSANIYNKESGEVTGSAKVLEHPSQHVKGYAQQAINEINYQLHPPKRFRFEGGHPLNSLHSAYPAHKGPPHGVVAKVGKFILLGEPGTISLDSLALPKHTYQSGALSTATYAAAAKKSIASMPETQKQAIKSYTGSSYHAMNSSLWSGNPSGAAKSAGEALHALGHDVTPGTVLSRKISVQGEALDQILKSTGKILQEPAIMSTSIRPSSWSGNVQLKMHVGPGVKGLWVGKGSVGSSGALSNHSGEDELILPPNTRLLILSVKKTSGPDADGFGGGGIGHVIEAVVLPSQAS